MCHHFVALLSDHIDIKLQAQEEMSTTCIHWWWYFSAVHLRASCRIANILKRAQCACMSANIAEFAYHDAWCQLARCERWRKWTQHEFTDDNLLTLQTRIRCQRRAQNQASFQDLMTCSLHVLSNSICTRIQLQKHLEVHDVPEICAHHSRRRECTGNNQIWLSHKFVRKIAVHHTCAHSCWRHECKQARKLRWWLTNHHHSSVQQSHCTDFTYHDAQDGVHKRAHIVNAFTSHKGGGQSDVGDINTKSMQHSHVTDLDLQDVVNKLAHVFTDVASPCQQGGQGNDRYSDIRCNSLTDLLACVSCCKIKCVKYRLPKKEMPMYLHLPGGNLACQFAPNSNVKNSWRTVWNSRVASIAWENPCSSSHCKIKCVVHEMQCIISRYLLSLPCLCQSLCVRICESLQAP